MKKGLLIIGLIVVLIGTGFAFSGVVTKDRGDELSAALDNVNPLIKVGTVYGLTNQAISHTKGQMGEDVYTYRLITRDSTGNKRQLTFTADHRLKLNHYLKIETKGQNVNTWEAVRVDQVPSAVQRGLTAS